MENHGKTVGKSWENHGKMTEHGDITTRIMVTVAGRDPPVEIHGGKNPVVPVSINSPPFKVVQDFATIHRKSQKYTVTLLY